jgi:hypothetical protein
MTHDDVDVVGDKVELRGEELLAVPSRGVEGPVEKPRLPWRTPEPEAEEPDSVVLKVVAAQSVRDAPGLDRLVMIAGDKDDLFSWGVLEPALEWPGQE